MSLVEALAAAAELHRVKRIQFAEKCLFKEAVLADEQARSAWAADSHGSSSSPSRAVQKIAAHFAEERFEEIFEGCSLHDAKRLSRSERQDRGFYGNRSMTYGEIEFSAFAEILRLVPGTGTFLDLGSGSGRAVLAARLMRDFEAVQGVELLSSLWAASDRAAKRFASTVAPLFGRRAAAVASSIRLTCGSILTHDWSHADVVFANSTCFTTQFLRAIGKRARFMRPGSHVVTFTAPLPSPCFEVEHQLQLAMSWGPATVFVQRRLPHRQGGPRRELQSGAAPPARPGGDSDSATSSSIDYVSDSGGDEDLPVAEGETGLAIEDNDLDTPAPQSEEAACLRARDRADSAEAGDTASLASWHGMESAPSMPELRRGLTDGSDTDSSSDQEPDDVPYVRLDDDSSV